MRRSMKLLKEMKLWKKIFRPRQGWDIDETGFEEDDWEKLKTTEKNGIFMTGSSGENI